jgi:hypothetical protein
MLKLPEIKKEYLLIAVSATLLIVSYQLAFKKTISELHVHKQLAKQLTSLIDVSSQPSFEERKNRNLDKILGLYKVDTANFRSNILSHITTIANSENVRLAGVPSQDAAWQSSGTELQKLDFEGGYFGLVKALKTLQQTQGIGVIRSVSFKTTDSQSARDLSKKLTMELYLEMALR